MTESSDEPLNLRSAKMWQERSSQVLGEIERRRITLARRESGAGGVQTVQPELLYHAVVWHHKLFNRHSIYYDNPHNTKIAMEASLAGASYPPEWETHRRRNIRCETSLSQTPQSVVRTDQTLWKVKPYLSSLKTSCNFWDYCVINIFVGKWELFYIGLE